MIATVVSVQSFMDQRGPHTLHSILSPGPPIPTHLSAAALLRHRLDQSGSLPLAKVSGKQHVQLWADQVGEQASDRWAWLLPNLAASC